MLCKPLVLILFVLSVIDIHILAGLTRFSLTSKNKNERDDAKRLKERMDSYKFVPFISILERILRAIGTTFLELQSPKVDFTVTSRLIFCSISELLLLRESWDSIKQTASALDSAWHTVAGFKPKS